MASTPGDVAGHAAIVFIRHNLSLPLLDQNRESVKWANANKEAGNSRWTTPK